MSKDGNREKCKEVHDMCQETEEAEMATMNFGVVRSKILMSTTYDF